MFPKSSLLREGFGKSSKRGGLLFAWCAGNICGGSPRRSFAVLLLTICRCGVVSLESLSTKEPDGLS